MSEKEEKCTVSRRFDMTQSDFDKLDEMAKYYKCSKSFAVRALIRRGHNAMLSAQRMLRDAER